MGRNENFLVNENFREKNFAKSDRIFAYFRFSRKLKKSFSFQPYAILKYSIRLCQLLITKRAIDGFVCVQHTYNLKQRMLVHTFSLRVGKKHPVFGERISRMQVQLDYCIQQRVLLTGYEISMQHESNIKISTCPNKQNKIFKNHCSGCGFRNNSEYIITFINLTAALCCMYSIR
jgi:hypothetical protein